MRYRIEKVLTTVNDPIHRGKTVYKVYDILKDRMSFASYKTNQRAEEICERKNNEEICNLASVNDRNK